MQVVIGIAFVLICSAVFVGCIENGNSSCKDLATINNRLSAEVENLTMAYNNKVDEYNYLVREYNNL